MATRDGNVILASILVGVIGTMIVDTTIDIYKKHFASNQIPKIIPAAHVDVVEDLGTHCQYVSWNGSMYPRLSPDRKHICDPSLYPIITITVEKE